MSMRRIIVAAALALAAAPQLGACGPSGGSRYTRKEAQKSLGKLEEPGLVVGEFRLTKVVDGDTIHVDGLDSSLRLLGVDTEETFKTEGDRRLFESGWDQYLKAKRGASPRPVKMATPLGEDAKVWAKHFFEGVDKVRVERDDPAEIRDRYNRYLAYVMVPKHGVWLNYAVECVRAGMGPYFPKYGNSRRFHADFLAAEAEAKAAKRGIWAPGAQHYPDYEEREAWWTARGDFVAAWHAEAEGKENYIDITHWDALKQLEDHVGKEVQLLGTVGEVFRQAKGPARVTISRRMYADFPLVFFDPDVITASGIADWVGEFVVVTGVPTIYENPHTHKKQVQIVVDRASQIRLSPVPGLTPPAR
jgi:endonuclease YncB( thermonuclease family)